MPVPTLRTITTVSILTFSLGVSAGGWNEDIRITAGSANDEYSSLNGSITVDDGVQRPEADLSAVNGSIAIGSDVALGDVKTVNGAIRIAGNARLEDVGSVNGRIEIARGAQIDGEVTTVNGRVRLDEGSAVTGDVGSVNGRISLRSTQVQGDVSNYNGGIEVLDGSIVTGDVVVKKPDDHGGDWQNERPRVVIGRNSQVLGRMIFEREVDLYVHDTATVGDIEGASPSRFSGSRP